MKNIRRILRSPWVGLQCEMGNWKWEKRKCKRRVVYPTGQAANRVAALTAAVLLCQVSRAAEAPALPAGILNFAAKLAQSPAQVLGEEHRAKLDELNRELRETERQLRRNPDAAVSERAVKAAAQVQELVRKAPQLMRLDLSGRRPVLTPQGEVRQPGDSGALLLEIVTPGDGVSFGTALCDLSQPRGESSSLTLEAQASGTNYIVATLERLPFGRTTLGLQLNRPGAGTARLPLDVVTPMPGRLKLAVLSDDTGKPVPAMVSLMWRTDGGQRRPANGIEFAPQFDSQGHASGLRAANLPGQLGAQFWCVPGPFDMTLAPGTWQIGVRRGVEHEVAFEDVTIKTGELTERTLRPRRWVDMRKFGYWSGDDHVHTRILSDDDARNVMAWIQAEDVHLANVVKMGDIYRTYFEQRGFGPSYRFIDGEHVLVPGQECPRTHDQIGHTLAMNITAMVRDPDKYFLYDTVFDAVHAQGGLTGYAHVNNGNFHVHRDMSINMPRGKVDFAEILQFNHLGTDLYYEFLNLGCKLTASAGSDVPWGGSVGEVRAYAYLGEEPFSADNWFKAFGRGRTFTTSGPMIEFTVDEAFPGDEIRLREERPLKIRARAWGDPARMAPVKLEIVRHGEVIRSAESRDPKAPEARLEFEVPAGEGCWIAARAKGGEGTSAHTTPVYVIREGLRFWKYEALDDLFAKREESLKQIEGLVAEAKRLDAEGRLENDRYRKLLAQQGDALLERVAAARGVYRDLKATAEKERRQRGGRGRSKPL